VTDRAIAAAGHHPADPIGVAVMTVVVGLLFLKDTRGVDMVTGSGVAIQQKT